MSDPTTYQPGDPDPGEEPSEDALVPKPPVADLPSDTELEAEPEPGEEDVPEEEFLDPEVARDDDTVDDEEHDE